MKAETKNASYYIWRTYGLYRPDRHKSIHLLLSRWGCSYQEANGPKGMHFLLQVVSAFEIHHYEHFLIANTIGNN